MSSFYRTFERRGRALGLDAHGTHYCPGCGHGLVHRYLAQAIDQLGVQDRTVAISPVGCAAFLYCYLDAGNSQAAHGRAPAVALGHKLANPDAIVVSYQGDGDLASIGLAEIIHAAQLGVPITVVFVNNATYGMTGGQMAPTTLIGQATTTSPRGRTSFMGQPLRMAETIAQLDGPIYVERVALFDARQRVRAQKAIRKALQLQVDNQGFAFVEVLAECPTHLKLSPGDSERWVRDHMLPVFPLGVKKDVAGRDWTADLVHPRFDPRRLLEVLEAGGAPAPRFMQGFPRERFGPEVALKWAGAGGDGAQTAALLITHAAIHEGFDATHIPSYGPESRGGTSHAEVHLAEDEVRSPVAPHAHVLVAFNAPSLARFGPTVAPGGVILHDRSVIRDLPRLADGVRVHGVPFTEIARDLGKPMVKNIVALGAWQAITGLLAEDSLRTAIRAALHDRRDLIPLNEQAFARGVQAV